MAKNTTPDLALGHRIALPHDVLVWAKPLLTETEPDRVAITGQHFTKPVGNSFTTPTRQ